LFDLVYLFFTKHINSFTLTSLFYLKGSSGSLGLFFENGPYYLNEALQLEDRPQKWNLEYNVLYLDQPVGTGYSYVGKEDGYATSQDEVATDLYFFLQEFYRQYPTFSTTPLFITGESYGGHYIPAFASKILTENEQLNSKVTTTNIHVMLEGIAIGDGFTEPCVQITTKPAVAYHLGIIDSKTYLEASVVMKQAVDACNRGDFDAAHDYRSQMENIVLACGINAYDIRTFDSYSYMDDRMSVYLNKPQTQEMLHVGNASWGTDSGVSNALYNDVMRSQSDKFPQILENIRVLLYQGQFDWKDGPAQNEKWINQVDWSGKEGYLSAKRDIWMTTTLNSQQAMEASGWVQSSGTLTELVVNAAGHLAPMDQPERLLSMISTFVENKEFVTKN
jgi:vitellogenic carboxypeptidase-like protein